MEHIVIMDVSSFVKYISEVEHQLRNKRSVFNWSLLFRGQNNISYDLLPSLARNYNGKKAPLLCHENAMISSAMVQFPDVFKSEYEPVEILALLQHYGIPTRLLDVSENALVGLYFACLGDCKNDGEVFAFKQDEATVRVKVLTEAIADSYRFAPTEITYLDTFYGHITNQPYYLEAKHMLEKVHKSTNDGAEWLKHYAVSPIFTKAQIHSLRQRIQAGHYIIFPNKIARENGRDAFLREIVPIPKTHQSIVGRVIVKGEAKHQILQELATFGISKQTLFPDNIDAACDEIKNAFIKL